MYFCIFLYIECPADHFKQHAGNETCSPCPQRSHTAGLTASRMCFCLEREAKFIDGQCVGENVTIATSLLSVMRNKYCRNHDRWRFDTNRAGINLASLYSKMLWAVTSCLMNRYQVMSNEQNKTDRFCF